MVVSNTKIESLWRHPVKGFTPEQLQSVDIAAGQHFPNDRMFAIEDGPSGFHPAAPAHISKMRFTVLARSAHIAGFKTRYLDDENSLEISHTNEDVTTVFDMSSEEGLSALASWFESRLGEDFIGPLKVIRAPENHRFMDHHTAGFISLINHDSVKALSEKTGEDITPLRFRGNVVFRSKAWIEDDWQAGQKLKIGTAEIEILKPTIRCKATHANPVTAEYDVDTVPLLVKHFKRNTMGVYAKITKSGQLNSGDEIAAIA